MATVINTPGTQTSDSANVGVILGVVLVLLLGILFIVYGVPALRNAAQPQVPGITIDNSTPAPTTNNNGGGGGESSGGSGGTGSPGTGSGSGAGGNGAGTGSDGGSNGSVFQSP